MCVTSASLHEIREINQDFGIIDEPTSEPEPEQELEMGNKVKVMTSIKVESEDVEYDSEAHYFVESGSGMDGSEIGRDQFSGSQQEFSFKRKALSCLQSDYDFYDIYFKVSNLYFLSFQGFQSSHHHPETIHPF